MDSGETGEGEKSDVVYIIISRKEESKEGMKWSGKAVGMDPGGVRV